MKNTQLQGQGPKQIQNDNLQQEVLNSRVKTSKELEPGISAISMKPGMLYPINYMEILPGTTIEELKIDNITRMLTPLVPTLDRVYIRISAFFVPHTRVWKNAEKILARKAQAGTIGTDELPFHIPSEDLNKTIKWRDNVLARYGASNNGVEAKEYNVLLARGYKAIINDYVRNKEYEPAMLEFDTDTVGTTEASHFENFLSDPFGDNYWIKPCQSRKSYYNNIKKNIQETTQTSPTKLVDHLDWQTRFIEQKQNIANANKNDWDIIAEMGGTQPVINDRTQYIGDVEYELNYQQITQSSATRENESPLGTTGSFSYSRANGTVLQYKEFKQHGFLHLMASITIDTKFDQGTPKELLKQNISQIYTPATSKKEAQTLDNAEVSYKSIGAVAFQPTWAEYKRIPSMVTGDMTAHPLAADGTYPAQESLAHWHNFMPAENNVTITGEYFRPVNRMLEVMSRNNALDLEPTDEMPLYVTPDMILNMAEIKARVKLPMDESTIESTSGARETR